MLVKKLNAWWLKNRCSLGVHNYKAYKDYDYWVHLCVQECGKTLAHPRIYHGEGTMAKLIKESKEGK